jgi:hypothetical protein
MKKFCVEKPKDKGNVEISTWASENSQVALAHKT